MENDWNFSARKAKQSNYTANYAEHTDELYYVFRYSATPNVFPDEAYQKLDKNSIQRQIMKNLTQFYANFAKFE